MSWFQFAAGLIRDAMSSGESTEPSQPSKPLPPEDIAGMVNLIDYHRAEIDKNFQTVMAVLKAEHEQRLRALRIQRRWNYALAAAVVVLAILSIILLRSAPH
jgi:hypothetical protein